MSRLLIFPTNYRLSLDGRNGRILFLDDETLLTYSGSAIAFHKLETGEMSVFRPTSLRNVDIVTVHPEYNLFAVAERGINPKLVIYEYPECKLKSEICDTAKLEYLRVAFSNSVYIAACTGIPEFKIAIWDAFTGAKIIEADSDAHVFPTAMIFNPGDWRELAVVYGESGKLILWSLESVSKSSQLRKRQLRMPFVDDQVVLNGGDASLGIGTVIEGNPGVPELSVLERTGTGISTFNNTGQTNTQKMNHIDIPRFAMAELVDPFAEEFEEEPFDRTRLSAVAIAFIDRNKLLVSCQSGHLFVVSFIYAYEKTPDNNNGMHSPPGQALFTYNFNLILRPSNADNGDSDRIPTTDAIWRPVEGDLQQIVVHSKGILCIGGNDEGKIRIVHHSAPHHLMGEFETGIGGIQSALFSPHYDHLALFSRSRAVLILPKFATELTNLRSRSGSEKDQAERKEKHTPLEVKNLPAITPPLEVDEKSKSMVMEPFVSACQFGPGRFVCIEPLSTELNTVVALSSGGCVQVWSVEQKLTETSVFYLQHHTSENKYEVCRCAKVIIVFIFFLLVDSRSLMPHHEITCWRYHHRRAAFR